MWGRPSRDKEFFEQESKQKGRQGTMRSAAGAAEGLKDGAERPSYSVAPMMELPKAQTPGRGLLYKSGRKL